MRPRVFYPMPIMLYDCGIADHKHRTPEQAEACEQTQARVKLATDTARQLDERDRKIWALAKSGERLCRIAERFGISGGNVSRIVERERTREFLGGISKPRGRLSGQAMILAKRPKRQSREI